MLRRHAMEAPAGAADQDGFRRLMSCFPTGVAVVTALGADGRPHGMTCTSLSSVTLTPPTLLVCLATGSGTLGALAAGGAFTVNLLHARAQGAAELFSAPVKERFAQVHWQPAPHLGQPWLDRDAFAFAECRLAGTTVVGDHAVVVGEVVHAEQRTDSPLLYGQRRFLRWPPAEAGDVMRKEGTG